MQKYKEYTRTIGDSGNKGKEDNDKDEGMWIQQRVKQKMAHSKGAQNLKGFRGSRRLNLG